MLRFMIILKNTLFGGSTQCLSFGTQEHTSDALNNTVSVGSQLQLLKKQQGKRVDSIL